MFPDDKITDLAQAPLFRNLDSAAWSELLPQLEWLFLAGGEALFRAGDFGDAMYVVIAGRLRISTAGGDGVEEAIREITRGESVGELALFTGKPRSATVRAIRDTELARFSRAAFENVLRNHPQIVSQLAVQIADRQSRGNDDSLSRRNIRTLAILPLDHHAPAGEFVRRMIEALRPMGAILHLSNPLNVANTPTTWSRMSEECQSAARLSLLESNHSFVIYECDVALSPWTERCIRQADLILIIAAADGEPEPSRLQALRDYFSSRDAIAATELLLLHRSNFEPEVRSNHWVRILKPNDHHHIVLNTQADAEKLARLLTGAAVGVVLSGGGARGFAHIGVIRALSERRIPIDAIGGTSMGAVIAAQYALGWDWQTMMRVNRQEWPRCEPQKNYTLPLVALNSGRRMDQMLRSMFGAAEIQNLRIKFFSVSTNLTRAEAAIHREGPLWKAVRASVSIPGIGPPAIENGEIYVDGGLVDNLPVHVMKKLCPGRVLAVDVSEQLEFRSKLKESYSVSGWRLLWQRLNPFTDCPDIPSMLNILYRTTTVGSVRFLETARNDADWCLSPPVHEFGVFDWRSIDKIIDIGYCHALRTLEESADLFSGSSNDASGR